MSGTVTAHQGWGHAAAVFELWEGVYMCAGGCLAAADSCRVHFKAGVMVGSLEGMWVYAW